MTSLREADRISVATVALPDHGGVDAGVRVKPLEWDEGKGNLEGQLVWSSGDPWVFWIVKNQDDPKYTWCENFNIEGWYPASPVRGVFSSLDEAKAAAQTDYEKRILSALSHQPAPVAANASAEARLREGPYNIKAIATVISLSYGEDPEADAELGRICTADNKPVKCWEVYEEQAKALFIWFNAVLDSLSAHPHASDCDKQVK